MANSENRLTDRQYWEEYYSKSEVDKDRVKRICGVYDKYWDILFSPSSKEDHNTLKFAEIGGYPGRYLAYLADRYNAEPTCIDFNRDTSKLKDVFNAFNVKNYNIIVEDVFKLETKPEFDAVLSFGFIEHFVDFNTVMDKHIEILKPGGRALIMIPNKRYLRRIYGVLFDYENLKAHNLSTMHRSVFDDFQKRNDLKLLNFSYFGGFPFNTHHKLSWIQKPFYKVIRKFFKWVNPWIAKHPNRFLSSTIIAVYEKPLD